jgi:ABC-type hemin transport system substrate-binding protein
MVGNCEGRLDQVTSQVKKNLKKFKNEKEETLKERIIFLLSCTGSVI